VGSPHFVILEASIIYVVRRAGHGGGGGGVKGKLANGVGTSERGVSNITTADAHTSAASSRLN